MFHINYYSAQSTSIKTRWGNQLVKIHDEGVQSIKLYNHFYHQMQFMIYKKIIHNKLNTITIFCSGGGGVGGSIVH